MKSLMDQYKEVIISNGMASILRAVDLLNNKEKKSFLLLNKVPSYEVEGRGFRLYPYERPNLSGQQRNNNKLCPLTILTPKSRFEYHTSSFDEEIKREFPDTWKSIEKFEERVAFLSGKLEDLRIASFWDKMKLVMGNLGAFYDIYFGNINNIYSRCHLPQKVRSVFNSILFVFSGLLKKKYSTIEAVKILNQVFEGVALPDDGSYSFRSQIMKELYINGHVVEVSDGLRLRKNKKLYEVFDKNFDRSPIMATRIFDDYDESKDSFIKEFDKVKGAYSDKILYPYSIYIKIENILLNRCIGRFCISLDHDDVSSVDAENIYIITVFKESEWYNVLRVSSFMSYESKDINNTVHKNRSMDMLKKLKALIPAIDIDKVEVYPDPRSDDFEFELNKCFSNIGQSDLAYTDSKVLYSNNGGVKN